jgi:hypothetical protein
MPNSRTSQTELEKDAFIVDFIRVALAARRWKVGDLARRAGMRTKGLSVELSRGVPTIRTRAAIEAAFDYQERLWTDLPTLALRRRCFTQFGFDPFLINSVELRRRAAQFGIHDWRANRSKKLLIERVLAWLAANPTTHTTPNETKA